MRCQNCGANLPKDAKYCDICGELNEAWVRSEKLKNIKSEAGDAAKKSANRFGVFFLALCCAMLLLIITALIFKTSSEEGYKKTEPKGYKDRNLVGWETIVKPEHLDKLEAGMTYEEICEIIGGEGKLVEKNDYSHTYSWPGEYYDGNYFGRLDVSFVDARHEGEDDVPSEFMVAREIIDGEEAYETKIIQDNSAWEKLDTVVVGKEKFKKLKEGMNYEQVCELFGGPGKISESEIVKHISDYSTRKEYVWKAKRAGPGDDRYTSVTVAFDDGILKDIYDWEEKYIE